MAGTTGAEAFGGLSKVMDEILMGFGTLGLRKASCDWFPLGIVETTWSGIRSNPGLEWVMVLRGIFSCPNGLFSWFFHEGKASGRFDGGSFSECNGNDTEGGIWVWMRDGFSGSEGRIALAATEDSGDAWYRPLLVAFAKGFRR